MQVCVGDIKRMIEEHRLLDDTIISMEFPARLGLQAGEVPPEHPVKTYGEGTSREIDVIKARGMKMIDGKLVLVHRTR